MWGRKALRPHCIYNCSDFFWTLIAIQLHLVYFCLMSKSVMRIISSILLIGFLGFLVPINNWHALAHNHKATHQAEHSKELTFKQGLEKCGMCDLQLPLLFHAAESSETLLITSFDFLFSDYICCELLVKDTHLSLRGPPVNELS
jgi:hypothetical protein